MINPPRTHAFIVSEGVRAKTDRSDARLLARFGQQKAPPPSPVLTDNARDLKELVGCRDDLTKTMVMEKNRLGVARDLVQDIHQTTIAFLAEQIARIDRQIADLISADADLDTRNRRLQSAPGVGTVLSAVLLARLPELGGVDAKALASLAGVAPHPQDSGTTRGYRATTGGRPAVCKALSQMAQTATRCTPVMQAHYQQRRRRMTHKPAVIACARRMLGILNAMVRDGLTWPETTVGQGQFLPQPA